MNTPIPYEIYVILVELDPNSGTKVNFLPTVSGLKAGDTVENLRVLLVNLSRERTILNFNETIWDAAEYWDLNGTPLATDFPLSRLALTPELIIVRGLVQGSPPTLQADQRHSLAKSFLEYARGQDSRYAKFRERNRIAVELAKRSFEEVTAMINDRKVEDVHWEKVVRRIIAILESDPGNNDVREMAAFAVYGLVHIRRCALEDSLLGHPVVAAEFAQCSSCAMCWVPHPSYKSVAQLALTNVVGGRCSHCEMVFCRNCYGNTFACPRCGRTLDHVAVPNGRTRPAPGCFR